MRIAYRNADAAKHSHLAKPISRSRQHYHFVHTIECRDSRWNLRGQVEPQHWHLVGGRQHDREVDRGAGLSVAGRTINAFLGNLCQSYASKSEMYRYPVMVFHLGDLWLLIHCAGVWTHLPPRLLNLQCVARPFHTLPVAACQNPLAKPCQLLTSVLELDIRQTRVGGDHAQDVSVRVDPRVEQYSLYVREAQLAVPIVAVLTASGINPRRRSLICGNRQARVTRLPRR